MGHITPSASIASNLATLSSLTLFFTADSALADAPFLVFYGPAQAAGPAASSSFRIQSHVVSPAGLLSFPRLAISPSSPLYAAVGQLSREDQGDDVCRALAYSILKYFKELPEVAKERLAQTHVAADNSRYGELFGESHAAGLASRMRKAPEATAAAQVVARAFAPYYTSCVDVDLVLPKDSIQTSSHGSSEGDSVARFGSRADLVDLFGDSFFIPTSKLRRALSKPPPASRGRGFSRQQKEHLRREMCELLDTEESYVMKMRGLVDGVVAATRARLTPRSDASDTALIKSLFPPSLDQIVNINSQFCEALTAAVENTEGDAIDDIECTEDQASSSPDTLDRTGATQLAQCLLEWFPRFSECYGQYIYTHSEFASLLKRLPTDSRDDVRTDLYKSIQEEGEQKLLSLLIEPVQRLPRYSLYLENMTRQLPIHHPALPLLLNAKDIIAGLCAQDTRRNSPAEAMKAMPRLVKSWPSELNSPARLISTIDLEECFGRDDKPRRFIGLLFASHFVLIAKDGDDCLSARGLLAEVDKCTPGSGAEPMTVTGLTYSSCLDLARLVCSSFDSNNGIQIIPVRTDDTNRKPTQHPMRSIQSFVVQGSYEARASRFAKEVSKAKLERRFSEKIRESGKWQGRELDGESSGVTLVTAIHEGIAGCLSPQICVETDVDASEVTRRNGESVVASITSEGEGFYRLEVVSDEGRKTKDLITRAEFMPVFVKRILAVLQSRYSLSNTDWTGPLLRYNEDALKSIPLQFVSRGRSPSKSKPVRQQSPVKALVNLFGAPAGASTSHKKSPSTTQAVDPTPIVRPNLGPKAPSESEIQKVAPATAPKVIVVRDSSSGHADVETLECCLGNYLLALTARKGNVVGRSIANRPHVKEPTVKHLCEAVLKNPQSNEATANAAVDVLFAAFEAFLHSSWQSLLGPIFPTEMLQDLLSKSDRLSAREYDEYAQGKIIGLAPQNQRALKAILETFIGLLEGMTNDGDRGSLVATLAEILVQDGQAHDFIPIFDRMIEGAESELEYADYDDCVVPVTASLSSSVATRSTQTGSLGSKASSLGRRFGLNSTSDGTKPGDSVLGAVFRTMSKSTRTADGSVRGKPDLLRHKSNEPLVKSSPRSRPGSKGEGSTNASVISASPNVRSLHDAPSAAASPAGPITTTQMPSTQKRSKRRSSLSDLGALPQPNTSPFWDHGTPSKRLVPEQSPLMPRALNNLPRDPLAQTRTQPNRNFGSLIRRAGTVSGPRASSRPADSQLPSTPITLPAMSREADTEKKENVSPLSTEEPSGGDSLPVKAATIEKPMLATGNNGLPSTRLQRPNSIRRNPVQTSPRKALARVQAQQTAISNAESTLRTELAKIGEELAVLSKSSPTAKPAVESGVASDDIFAPTDVSTNLQAMAGRLKALETKMPHMISNLTRQVDVLQRDIDSLQQAPLGSNSRVAELERELHAARSEQDAAARRHAEDTKRIFEQNRRGRPQSEMERKMCEAMDEAARWREECLSLRHENTSLRSQLEKR